MDEMQDEIQFIFQVSEVDKETLFPQISAALEKRLEIRSQQLNPRKNMLNQSNMTPEQRQAFQKRQRTQKIIWGVVLVALGLYLLIPSVMNPSGQIFQLVVGAIAVIVGLNNLLRGGKQKEQPKNRAKFDSAAREFLDGQEESTKDKKLQIAFFDEEMVIITGEVEDLEQEAIPYSDVEVALETKDVFLLTHSGRGVLLQKQNLSFGELDEFRAFIGGHVKIFEQVKEKAEPAGEAE